LKSSGLVIKISIYFKNLRWIQEELMRHILNWLMPTLTLCLLLAGVLDAQQLTDRGQFNGSWKINEDLSDDTDRQVEIAILKAGGRLPRTGKKGKGRYKGGPKEQEIYDHISYDEKLEFDYSAPEFRLVYEDGFERTFYSDNRKRVISASGTVAGDNQDFSFASWDENRLLVESRPRDGGWIIETYVLDPKTSQLKISLELKPSSFAEPIFITRVYDRAAQPE
jgi:hypothetical protein